MLAWTACSASGDGSSAARGAGGSATGSSGGSAGSAAAGGSAGSAAAGGAIGPGSGGSAGAAGFAGDACAGMSLATEASGKPADIIIAIDQSTSMNEETLFVQQQINAFASQSTSQGVDARIVLIVENPSGLVGENPICVPPPLAGPNCGNNPGLSFTSVNHHVDSHDAFAWILDCYSGGSAHQACYDSESVPYSCQFAYNGVLRPESVKHVVVITDDEPCGSATTFDTELRALNPSYLDGYVFHAIVPFTDCAYRAGPPDEYLRLVQQRGGLAGDLCLQDFQPVWDQLAQSVVRSSLLACEWNIPQVPSGQQFDPNRVNVSYTVNGQRQDVGRVPAAGDCATAVGGWYYNDPLNPTKILVCPEVCDTIKLEADQRQQLDILVGCQTVPATPR